MGQFEQDIFLSHATLDKRQYVEPLAEALCERDVTFWLDSAEIGWGDNITRKLNEGLRSSRYALVCLSAHFLERPWPEQELSAVLSLQNTDGQRRLLPLILNSREHVLQTYPLIAGMSYREWGNGPSDTADEIANLVKPRVRRQTGLTQRIVVESVHTGTTANLDVTPKHSIQWVISKATAGLGLREALDTGGFQPFHIRWVLVDVEVENFWRTMPRPERQDVFAIVWNHKTNTVMICTDDLTPVGDLGLSSSTVVHLHGVEDERFSEPVAVI